MLVPENYGRLLQCAPHLCSIVSHVYSKGFPLHIPVFAGNASEPATLEEMLLGLRKTSEESHTQTVVLDAGLASQDNIDWLSQQGRQQGSSCRDLLSANQRDKLDRSPVVGSLCDAYPVGSVVS